MSLKVGALFAGYGGLDMAVMHVLDAELAWYAEWEQAPAKVMAHHHPDVPNLWDVTKVDWAAVDPVDIITGGSPCQDLSHAGKRKGMTDGTRSNLWAEMREAIAVHRPRLVVWENVRGAYSASADSDLEPCPRCVGGAHDRGPVLRALGRVLGDLAELGYDARWYGLRAADVGAAHGRFRVFVIAHPAADAGRLAREVQAGWGLAAVTVAARDGNPGRTGLTLLGTPRCADGMKRDLRDGVVNPRGRLEDQISLLPTPSVADVTGGRKSRSGERSDELLLNGIAAENRWGDYASAIARWESATGGPAPEPTEPNAKGGRRLSPVFVEWLMGLPAGHVTNPTIGISRNDQLKALGNGVVWQQAAAALVAYIHDEQKAAA